MRGLFSAGVSGLALLAICASVEQASGQETAVGSSSYLPSNVSALLAPGSRRFVPGIRLGSFIVLPEASSSLVFDDNVFASPTNTEEDFYTNIDARVGVVSNWSRHAVEMYVGGGGNFYNEFDSENVGYGNVGIAGRLDIQRDFYVKAYGEYAYGFEARGSGESFQNFLEPVEKQSMGAGALVHKRFNRLWGEIEGSVSDEEFFDARTSLGEIDQSFRNGTAYAAGGRLGYEISPKTSVFAESSYDTREYEDGRVDGDGYKVGVGARYELTRITSAEAAIGYRYYDPSRPEFDEIDDWYYRARLRWDVTPLMTVALVGSRDVGSPSQDGTGSNRINTEIGVRADYAWKRDVTLNAGLAFGAAEYVDSGRDDEYYRVALGADYWFRPWLSFWANYSYLDYESDIAPTIDYDKSVVTIGVRAQY